MKKLFLSILLCAVFALSNNLFAQRAYSYGFESATAAYTALSGDTEMGAGLTAEGYLYKVFSAASATDSIKADASITVTGIPLGFTFEYCGQNMTHFAVGSAGVIYLGTSEDIKVKRAEGYGYNRPIDMVESAEEGTQNIIYLMDASNYNKTCGNAAGTTKISYKLESAKLTVQFSDLAFILDGMTPFEYLANYQISLHSDGSIKMHFSTFTPDAASWASSGTNLYVGFKGNLSNNAKDFHFRTGSTWETSTFSNSTATLRYGKADIPAAGLLYNFTAPTANCEAPAQITDLETTKVTSTTAELTHTASADAENTLFVIVEGPEADSITLTDGVLVNNTNYTSVTGLPGTAFYATTADFERTSLKANTTYTVYAFSYNQACIGSSPTYTEPVTIEFTTLYDKPTMTAEAVSTDSIKLVVAPSVEGKQVLVLVNDQVIENPETFRLKPSNLTVGQELDYGIKVLYKGDAGTFYMDEIEGGSLCYFVAYTYDENDVISTAVASANAMTFVGTPALFDFENDEESKAAKGFTRDPNYPQFIVKEGRLRAATETFDAVAMSFMPPIVLGDAASRLSFSIDFTLENGTKHSLAADNDFRIQIYDEDDLDNGPWVTVKKVDNTNFVSGDDMNKFVVDLSAYKNQVIKVRLRVNVATPNWYVYTFLDNIRVEEIPACEYPTNITIDNSNYTDRVALSWEDVASVNAWELSFSNTKGEWSEPVASTSKNDTLLGLTAGKFHTVRIRTVCGVDSISPWENSPEFITKYAAPFFEEFTADAASKRVNVWKNFATGELPASGDAVLTSGGNWYAPGQNKGDRPFRIFGLPQATSWWMTPVFEVEAENEARISFKTKIKSALAGTDFEGFPEGARFAVVAADEEGNFNAENMIKEWSSATDAANKIDDLENASITLNLGDRSGDVQLAFYFETTYTDNPEIRFELDSIKVSYVPEPCALPTNLTATDITSNSAVISWDGEAVTYNLGYKKASDEWTVKSDIAVDSILLSELLSSTEYSYRVQAVCAENESDWTAAKNFTTKEAVTPCAEPTNLKATVITTKSVVLSWDGDADAYAVEYKEKLDESGNWTAVNDIAVDSLFLDNLTAGLVYEYRVKAVCGDQASEWVNGTDFLMHTTSIKDGLKEQFNVYASNGNIYVNNPNELLIQEVEVINVYGQRLVSYRLQNNGDVVLPANIENAIVIVKVLVDGDLVSYKLLVK